MSDLGLYMGIYEILARYIPYYVLDEKEQKIVDDLHNRIDKLIKEV